MKRGRFLVLIIIILLGCATSALAISQTQIDAAKNYLWILVHSRGNNSGIFDTRKPLEVGPINTGPFSNLKGYLEKELSLEGYVYSYDFSKDEDTIEHWGWELGDRNYDNPGAVMDRNAIQDASAREHKVTKKNGKGLCWLEQAREDFRAWYARNHPPMKSNEVPEHVIPKKYILITHCMGGLAARHYIYGRGSDGKRYYRNDVAKVIMISTPNKGAGGPSTFRHIYAKKWTSEGPLGYI